MLIYLLRAKHYRIASFRFSSTSYIQGQAPPDQPKVREYFYHVDSFGQLFLDDTRFKNFTSCYKDPKFLNFFFSRLRKNTYHDRPYVSSFPYVSLCGRERNFVRCDDVPLVITRLLEQDDLFELCHIPSTELSIRFEPEKIYVKPETGRIYHPIPEKFYTGIALIKDAIAEQLSTRLVYANTTDDVPVGIEWKGRTFHFTDSEEMKKTVQEHSRFEM